MLTKIKNIASWLEEAGLDKRERQRREAIHILFDAIASSESLSAKMAMKGGVLLAIRYSSSRYTIDVDFSTTQTASEVDTDLVREELDRQLMLSSERLPYGMSCLVQRFKKEPNDPRATAPTFQITIGYAYKSDRNSLRRLQARQASTVIKIDYSFNEIIHKTEEIYLSDEKAIMTYSYCDLVAEKYRALLQQSTRNRWRSQDVYDLYYLFKNFGDLDKDVQKEILGTLLEKSRHRGLFPTRDSLSDPEVKRRAARNYSELQKTIYEELPGFDMAYQYIQDIYERLPWE